MKDATIHFYCLFDETCFSDICMIMELKELHYCVNIWKTSEVANLVFQWTFVLKSVKHKFFPLSIVKDKRMSPFKTNPTRIWVSQNMLIMCIEMETNQEKQQLKIN